MMPNGWMFSNRASACHSASDELSERIPLGHCCVTRVLSKASTIGSFLL